MLKHNYHTHTTYCRHADNKPEDSIKQAIKIGLKTLGFSEHIQVPGDSGKYRIANAEEEKEYIDEIKRLKLKYQKQITIFCGFEADISDPKTGKELYTHASSKLALPGVDYLIIGHHWYPSGNHAYIFKPTLAEAKKWLAILKAAWKTNNFKYVAHPDGFANAFRDDWNEVAYYLAEEITKFAAANNMPLGFNVNGMYEGQGFPSKKFWKIASKNKAKAVIELDAHDLPVFDPKYSNEAERILKELKVEIIDKIM